MGTAHTSTTPKAYPDVQAVLENPLEPLALDPSISFEQALSRILAEPRDPEMVAADEKWKADPANKLLLLQNNLLAVGWQACELLDHQEPGIRSQAQSIMQRHLLLLAQLCAFPTGGRP